MIHIDGSYHEGGGQILRTSLSLSAITQKPFKITKIRVKREKKGLFPQHLIACKAVQEITTAIVTGAELGSTELTFQPQGIRGGEYIFKVGTAGSVALVAQTILPVLLKANRESQVIIEGGTHVPHSPSVDYLQYVFLPALSRFNIHIKLETIRYGFYPKGGGCIKFTIVPGEINGNREWRMDKKAHAIIRLFKLPDHIAKREENILAHHGIENIEIVSSQESYSPGNSILIWREFCGATSLGEIGKRAEVVAEEAFYDFQQERADVDLHLADQLLVYAAIATMNTEYQTSFISDHLQTNAYIISQFVDKKIAFDKNGWIRVGMG